MPGDWQIFPEQAFPWPVGAALADAANAMLAATTAAAAMVLMVFPV